MCDWWKFTSQSQNFTENLNGPYGPYEHILQDRSQDLWTKKWVLDENSKTWPSKKLKIQFWDPKLTFWELTSREFIHFHRNLQKSFFTKILFWVTFFHIQAKKIPKNKMVRMVHMNIFYRMDLEICDSKSEFLTKTEDLGFRKIENFSFGVQNWFLRVFPKTKWLLKIFWTNPQSSRLNFHI